jgi:hypothetical protein
MEQLQIANQIEIEKLRLQNERMKILATRNGFFNTYFKMCKDFNSNKEAFDALNEEYHLLFNEYRYSDHESFRSSVNHQHKKR